MAMMTLQSNSDLADMLEEATKTDYIPEHIESLIREAAYRLRLWGGVNRDTPDRVGSLDARLRVVESMVGDLVAAEASRKAREANRG